VALVGLLIFAVTHQEMPQFHGKAMLWRALLYPAVTLIVPAYWWLILRHRGPPYPFALDILVSIPPLFDSLGNAHNMYDRVVWWDDFNHFVNPVFIALALGLLFTELPLGRFALGGFVVGLGMTLAVVWELAEYVSFVQRSPEFNTAYQDTMGDLALDLVGSILGAATVVILLRKRGANRPRPSAGRAP
jgi:uncharacterized membrane protein YjdF